MTDSGVRLAGHRISWTIGGYALEASLSDIVMIRLLTEVETSRGPMGTTACQLNFRDGKSVSIFGGNSYSPDQAARLARYRAFVNDLHQRLGPAERVSIRFVAGFGGARFGFPLVLATILGLFLVGAVVALFVKPTLRLAGALVFCVVSSAGVFRLLQLNAPHVYDPAYPLDSAEN